MSTNNPYGQTCRTDIPYPSVSSESVPSLIDNLVNALYGTITKTVVDRKVVWDIPCDPDNTATVLGVPRLAGEGLLCYFIRVFNDDNLPAKYLYGGNAGSIPYQSGVSQTTFLPIGQSGYALTSNGSAPVWSQIVNESAIAYNISGGNAGSLIYQLASNSTAKLPLGASGSALTSNGTFPVWSASVNRAGNLSGGALGSIPYQSASNTTAFLAIAPAGNILRSSGSAPFWSSAAPSADALVGGSLGSIPYQNGVNSTAFISPGTSGFVLKSNGFAAPIWDLVYPSNLSAGSPSWSSDGSSVISANSTSAALRVTQVGFGESLRIEDSANPDATPFVVSSGGQVGIGVTPDASVCLSLDSTGVKFSDGSIQTTSGLRAKGQILATGTVVQPGSLNIQSINATTTGQKIITFAAAAGVTGTSSVVATLIGASNGFIRVSSISANTATIQTANTAGAATDLAFSIAVF